MALYEILEDGHGSMIEDGNENLISVSSNANIYFVDAYIDPQSVLTGGQYRICAKLEDKAIILQDGSGRLIEDGSGNLIEVPEPKGFAIYSADDNSLTFYGDSEVPGAGIQYNGKTATNVYTDVDTWRGSVTDVPWYRMRSRIVSVTFDRSFETVRPISLYCWFRDFENCEKIDLRYLNTSETTTMSSMFSGSVKITDLDLSGFDTSNVTDMSGMFSNMFALKEIDLSGFDTSNVTDMSTMFYGCSEMTALDVSGFRTQNLISMGGMFSAMTNIKTIYSDDDNFTVENISYGEGRDVFTGCYSLVGGLGTAYDETSVSHYMAHVDSDMNPGYFTQK